MPVFAPKSLHLTTSLGQNYTVCNCLPFSDTENYTYDNDGNITEINENIYLMGTGTQYIDTEHIPTLVTRSEMEIRFSSDTYTSTPSNNAFFGITDKTTNSMYELNFGNISNQGYSLFPWICRYNGSGGPSWCSPHELTITHALKTTKQTVILDAKKHIVKYGNLSKNLPERQTSESASIYLFGEQILSNNASEVMSYKRNKELYWYATRIYEDDILVHNFIPVPCGLKIGNFVVPENGMWDTIEKKFHGNMGSGTFIYGSDSEI